MSERSRRSTDRYLKELARQSKRDQRIRAAAPDLYAAAKVVLDGLNARIDAAPRDAIPVFDGIALLHAAINKAELP